VQDEVLSLIERANRERAAPAKSGTAGEQLEQRFHCSQRLAVYGTLAPGESNHHLVAMCAGTWTRGTVPGRRGVRQFPVFTYDPEAPSVAVQLLASADLPAHWPRLDAFEGPDYPRILVPVFVQGRLLAVANLYSAREPVAVHETKAR